MRLPFLRAPMYRASASRQRACWSDAGRKACLVLVFVAMTVGCGDDKGAPPVLTGYTVPWPPRFVIGFLDAMILGRVSFEDPDGDVVLLHTAWRDCGTGEVRKLDTLQEDLKGMKTGEILFRAVIDTDCPPGDYAVHLSVTDGRGQDSNVLSVPYEIYEPSNQGQGGRQAE